MHPHTLFVFYFLFPLTLAASVFSFNALAVEPSRKFTQSPRTVLKVGLVHDNVNERYLIFEIEKEFEKVSPDIDLQAIGIHTNTYKHKVIDWLSSGEGPDVFYWYGSERLFELAKEQWVSPIDDLWRNQSLMSSFDPSVIEQVKDDESYFGVPVSYYSWSFFFNKQLFQELDISPPHTWEDFLTMCAILKDNDIIPIAIGYRSPWVLTAWFELLNLRLNGKAFHDDLLRGLVAYTDPRVRKVFSLWKVLIDKEYFLESGEDLDWEDPMPYLYREAAGVTLIGQFFSIRIPKNVKENISLFSFPDIIPGQQRIELAPADVFFIRSSSHQQEASKRFLAFMATMNAQIAFAKHAGGFSPLLDAPHKQELLDVAGRKLLRDADGTSPYFDRSVPTSFASPAMNLLKAFMVQPDIDFTTSELEKLRIEMYKAE